MTNFRSAPVTIDAPADADWVLGGDTLDSYDLAILRVDSLELQVRLDEGTDN